MRSILSSFASFLAALVILPAIAVAQGVWSELPPGERWEHACAYDPDHQTMIVFGGLTNEGSSDTQTYSLAVDASGIAHWRALATTGGPPPSRSAATMVYDSNSQRMILFGGFGAGYLNDVWALDVNTLVWTELLPTGTPPSPRGFHTAIYDAANVRMVMFGGFGGADLNDTWVLSLIGAGAWAPLVTVGGPPSARSSHSAIFDGGGRMYVFGGSSGGNDTWRLTLPTATWSLVATSGGPPPARYAHVALHDQTNARMVIHGGNTFLNDVWSLSLTTFAWSQVNTFPSPEVGFPSGRYFHSVIYDAANQRMLMYGGSESSILGDTWLLPLSGVAQWRALSPTPRYAAHGAFDPSRNRFMVYSGLTQGGLVLEDLWAYDLHGFWTQVIPAGPKPPPRFLGSWIYDRTNDRYVLFGGFGTAIYNDVWSFSPGTATWTQLFPGGTIPPVRYGHTAVYDQAGARMLVYSGLDNVGPVDQEVWSLRLVGPPTWTKILTVAPAPRDGHVAVWDPVFWGEPSVGDMVIFGGRQGGVPLNDTWLWIASNPPTWNALAAGSPGDRYYSTAIYDAPRDRMLLFGGNSGGVLQQDLWELPFYGLKTWSQEFPLGPLPQPRQFAAGAYALGPQKMLVFSGRGNGIVLNDLWQLDLSGVPVAVAPATADRLQLGPVTPNPAAGRMRMSLVLPRSATVDFSVYDLAGRLTWSSSRSLDAGRHELEWDGRAAGGARARAGVYLARVRVGASEQSRRFVMMP